MLARALPPSLLALLASACGQGIFPWDGGTPVDPSKPKIVALSPDAGLVEAGGSIQFAFTVDAAPASGVDLWVSVAPASVGTVPATAHLPGGAVGGTFTFTGGTAWAEGTVSITGGSIATAPVMVARGLVISELAPAGPLGASDEFIELYNPTSQEIQLSGWELKYSSVSNPDLFSSWHAFGAGEAIPSHGFYVVGNDTMTVKDMAANGVLMAAAGGAIRLLQGTTIVDQLGWGTGNSEGTSAPAPATAGSLERKARSGATASSLSSGADQRLGNAYDSDDNANDFVLRTAREPQTALSGVREP